MKKKLYEIPAVERFDIALEKGFAASPVSGGGIIELPGYNFENVEEEF